MAGILRGEVRWADLNPVRGDEQAGRRPVLILSHDVFNARSGTVIAVALTSQPQKAGFPLTLEIEAAGLGKPAWVKISQDLDLVGRTDRQAPGADRPARSRQGHRRLKRDSRRIVGASPAIAAALAPLKSRQKMEARPA